MITCKTISNSPCHESFSYYALFKCSLSFLYSSLWHLFSFFGALYISFTILFIVFSDCLISFKATSMPDNEVYTSPRVFPFSFIAFFRCFTLAANTKEETYTFMYFWEDYKSFLTRARSFSRSSLCKRMELSRFYNTSLSFPRLYGTKTL